MMVLSIVWIIWMNQNYVNQRNLYLINRVFTVQRLNLNFVRGPDIYAMKLKDATTDFVFQIEI
jgi:hypothetical protein